MRRILLFSLISGAFLIFLAFYQSIIFSDKKLHITFCDVGQGDAVLIKTPGGSDILIDGGPDDSVSNCLSRHMPLWDRTIEAIFLTHPDADHLTGLIGIVRTYNVEYFGTSKAPKDSAIYQELLKVLSEKKVAVNYVYNRGGIKTSDGFVIINLWPTNEFTTSGEVDTNSYSLVQEVSYDNFHALLTGDIPFQILDSIMPTIPSLTVFKPPHHGSKTGIDGFTFQHLAPSFAAISVGAKNRYGHPSTEVLNLLQKFKISYKRTDKVGDIEIISDGKSWQAR